MSNFEKAIRVGVAIVVALGAGYLVGIILRDASERSRYVNKYTCATYGYYEDCKTPLKPEDKLK